METGFLKATVRKQIKLCASVPVHVLWSVCYPRARFNYFLSILAARYCVALYAQPVPHQSEPCLRGHI